MQGEYSYQEATPAPVQEVPEKVSEEVIEESSEDGPIQLDLDYIDSLGSDKDKLEDYGKTFGIDLKKSRSFKNMVKDLKAYLKA
jgi:hypothetical protein